MSLWYDIKHKSYAPDGKGNWFCAYVDAAIAKLTGKTSTDLSSHGLGTLARHNASAIDCSDEKTVQQALDTEKAERIAATNLNSQSISTINNTLNEKIDKDSIANNLNTNDTAKVLSAAQGKVLNDSKVDKIWGKVLSTHDFTTNYKTKLDSLDSNLSQMATAQDVGDISNLITSGKSDTVSAINELKSTKADNSDIGDLTELSTTAKDTVVDAVNELNDNKTDKTTIGDLSKLNNTNKSSIVNALNDKVNVVWGKVLSTHDFTTNYKTKLDSLDADLAAKADKSDMGDLTELSTTAKSDIVSAINELDSKQTYGGNSSAIGDLSTLATTEKTSLVNAINELNSNKVNTSTIGDLSRLNNSSKSSIVNALNDKVNVVWGKVLTTHDFTTKYKTMVDNIGEISDLTTTAQTIVGAINELKAAIDAL